jgi:hypothetical protein
MSRMEQVIETLEAERAEAVERVEWLDRQLEEFRGRSGADGDGAVSPAPRSTRRLTARRASSRRATARRRQVDVKARIIDYLKDHPSSTAGDVAKAINASRGTVSTRLSQMAKTGEITKATKGYTIEP